MEVEVTVTSGDASDDRRRRRRATRCRPERRCGGRGGHDPRRHRRLDLRALARDLLSEGPAAGAGARAIASRHLTSIEINGTFYRTQTPATFRKWAARRRTASCSALKGPGYVTNRTRAARGGPEHRALLRERHRPSSAEKLGPILWQLAPTKKFVEEEFAGFLELLPRAFGGRRSGTPWKCGTTASRRRSSSR